MNPTARITQEATKKANERVLPVRRAKERWSELIKLLLTVKLITKTTKIVNMPQVRSKDTR